MENPEEKTVLLVDPSETARKLLAMRLSSMELDPVEASSLEAVETALATMRVQLVVSEWKLNDLEGPALFQKFRKGNVPVFLFTDKVRDQGLQAPELAAVFHKSQRAELLRRVEEFFEAKPAAEPAEPAAGRHILLIEDSATIRRFLRRVLEKNFPGCVIREAEEGRQAISEMTNKKVDLIVTDLQMPGMDGQSFLKILHRNPVLKGKPVLVLSGAITTELRSEFKACGTVRLLAKPSSEEEITETLRELMKMTEPSVRPIVLDKDNV